MPSLKEQLAALEDSPPPAFDPEDDALDSLAIPADRAEGREHYAQVAATGRQKEARAQQVLGQLGEKYGGRTVDRRKIFEDDDDEEDEAGPSGSSDEEDEEDEDGGSEDSEEEEEDGLDEDREENEEEDDDEDADEDEADEDDDEGNGEDSVPRPAARASSSKSLDPVAALRSARQKDVEKGRAIRRQKQFFDSLISVRITLQKALVASAKLSLPVDSKGEDEAEERRNYVLGSLSELSEDLFRLRNRVRLPGVAPAGLRKRKRDGEVTNQAYWMQSGNDALAMSSATNTEMLPILHKWSTKIQAATLQVNSRQAGSSRFLASTRSAPASVVEAIESGLSARRDKAVPFYEAEETAYRALLREVIDSRSSSASASNGADLSHLRREKKKKREAERGGSKGRKLRYTVHEKAQNFVVAQSLRGQWSEEQMDELFGSLLGGAGTKGAAAEEGEMRGLMGREVGLGGDLGGLRLF